MAFIRPIYSRTAVGRCLRHRGTQWKTRSAKDDYKQFSDITKIELDRIAYYGALEIERNFHGLAVPVPCDGPYEYWDSEKMEGRGQISMRHAAVAAGLGTLGKNTLLLNEKFGNTLNIGAVLTDIELPSDDLAESICQANCRLCLDSCPAGALDGASANQKLCRMNTLTTPAVSR
jgi:epoxyqueuosine reductase QueG